MTPKSDATVDVVVFIHSSIKTRIETPDFFLLKPPQKAFLYIVPLKQGLKHLDFSENRYVIACFYT